MCKQTLKIYIKRKGTIETKKFRQCCRSLLDSSLDLALKRGQVGKNFKKLVMSK